MKKPMKIVLSVLITILILFLIFLIVWGITFFRYYPQYRKNQRQLNLAVSQSSDEIRIMSSNVRCLAPIDFGEKNWFFRADYLLEGIENQSPTIIGFQEVTKWQYNFLTDALPEFDSIITYRDKTALSEACPIFYRTDLYNLIDKGSFWLSETPEKISRDWNSACYRVCSYIILETKSDGKQFVVFNTHLDHESEEARIKGIGVVLDKIKQFGSLPCIIMGDFNVTEDSETYKMATENFLDAKYQTENTMKSCTYQRWGEQLDRENIDYFMISKTGIEVNEYKVITDTYDSHYASDHFPIFTVLKIE